MIVPCSLKNLCVRNASPPISEKLCLTFPHHEQPGANLLVLSSDVPVNNITLPPHNMKSTWAGDYAGEFKFDWKKAETQPYFIHWAGMKMDEERSIHHLIDPLLSAAELKDWHSQVKAQAINRGAAQRIPRALLRKLKRAFKAFASTAMST